MPGVILQQFEIKKNQGRDFIIHLRQSKFSGLRPPMCGKSQTFLVSFPGFARQCAESLRLSFKLSKCFEAMPQILGVKNEAQPHKMSETKRNVLVFPHIKRHSRKSRVGYKLNKETTGRYRRRF